MKKPLTFILFVLTFGMLTETGSAQSSANYTITASPKFNPSLPSTSNQYVYYYKFCADSTGVLGSCQNTGIVAGNTIETVQELISGTYQTTRDKQGLEFQSKTTYPCSNPPWPSQYYTAIRNFTGYTPSYTAYYDTELAIYNAFVTAPGYDTRCKASDNATTVNFSGTGYSGWYKKASQADFFTHTYSCCNVNPTMWGWSGYLEISLTVNAGASVPSISSIVGALPCATVNQGPSQKTIVTIKTVGDASDHYYGGVYNGTFKISRTSCDNGSSLTVYFSLSGTATSPCAGGAIDYNIHPPSLSAGCYSSVVIPAGQDWVNVGVDPIADYYGTDPLETVDITLTPDTAYHISSEAPATTVLINN